ncbi:MAG: urea ABC transporter ATP-binding protein UrtD [Acidimicrobiia bacterium]
MTAPATPTAAERHPAPPWHHEAVLEVQGLTAVFDGFVALDGVDFVVDVGEARFVIGPNGAGKTTLVDCITGLTRPTSGTIRFGGENITGRRPHDIVRKGVGRTFQTPTVFDALTVGENLDLASSFRRRFHTWLRARRGHSPEVREVLDRIGLATQVDEPAGALSHGQKQWLEIGMLLAQKPRLMLLDEVVAGMSPQERIDTGMLLRELATDHTIVVIEHDMAFLRRFATAVTVLHEGKVLSEGTVEEVQADPIVREVYLGRSRDARSGAVPEAGGTESVEEGT